ncbi:MAG: hypothetical protein MJ196_01175 [Treponemataceae bacterium]|nr:hypothetical protein [Treponemataceae bacterium]
MKFAKYFVFCFAVFALISCSSVPNEQNVRLENECAENAAVADAFFERGMYDKAAEYYKKALKSKKYADAVSYKLACSYALSGKYGDALPVFDVLLKKDISNRSIKEALAYTTLMNGNLEEGCRLYEELSADNPADAKLMRNYIKTLYASDLKEKVQAQTEVYLQRFGKDNFTNEMQKKLQAADNESKDKTEEKTSADKAFDKNTETSSKVSEDSGKSGSAASTNKQPEPADDFDMPDWMSEFD